MSSLVHIALNEFIGFISKCLKSMHQCSKVQRGEITVKVGAENGEGPARELLPLDVTENQKKLYEYK